MDQIKQRAGQRLNMTDWFTFFTFDVMAEFAFGQPFGMLASGEPHIAMQTIHSGMKHLGVLSPVPWLGRILLKLIPPRLSGALKFKAWCAQQVQRRRQVCTPLAFYPIVG